MLHTGLDVGIRNLGTWLGLSLGCRDRGKRTSTAYVVDCNIYFNMFSKKKIKDISDLKSYLNVPALFIFFLFTTLTSFIQSLSIIHLSFAGSWGGCNQFQLTMGEQRGTP